MVLGAMLGAKIVPKWIQQFIKKLMDRSWKGSWVPTGTHGLVKSARTGSTGRPILKGRVKTFGLQNPEGRFACARPLASKGLLARPGFQGLSGLAFWLA